MNGTSATMAAISIATPRPAPLRALSSRLYRRRTLLLLLLLLPPLLWFGVVYAGSLFVLLLQSFYTLDEFSGQVLPQLTLSTYGNLLTTPSNLDIIFRTVAMACAVTLASVLLAYPLAYYMARYARGRTRALLYLAVMVPLWSSYLVRVYAWRLILAREGIVSWVAGQLHLGWLLDAVLAMPVLGGPALSTSYLGMFVVFTYVWLPYMILPIQAALERVPENLLQASSDLGARPSQTFFKVLLPLSLPGVVAGSIFTFSLTLGDYIIPGVVGAPGYFIGQMVYVQQGTAGNIPLAAAFSVVPVVLISVYLVLAKRLGAFDAL